MTDIKKRITLEGAATLQGILALVGNVPMEVPADAEIVEIDEDCNFGSCFEDSAVAEDGNTISITFEWSA